MNKENIRHFVLAKTTEKDRYYIIYSIQNYSKGNYCVVNYQSISRQPLLIGQEVELVNNTDFTPDNTPIFNIKAKFDNQTQNSQENRLNNLEFVAKHLANSITPTDYLQYLNIHQTADCKTIFQKYIHSKSDKMLNVLLSAIDVTDETAPKNQQNDVILLNEKQKIYSEEREYYLNETIDIINYILYTMQITAKSTNQIAEFDTISNNAIAKINKSLDTFNLINESLVKEYNNTEENIPQK